MKKLLAVVCLMFALSSNYLASQVSGNVYEYNGIRKELIQALPDDNIEKYWYNDKYFTQDYSEKYEAYEKYRQEKYAIVTPKAEIMTPDGAMNYLLIEFVDIDSVIETFFTENQEIISKISQVINKQYQADFDSLRNLQLDIYENEEATLNDVNEYQYYDFVSDLGYILDIAENSDENIERKKIIDAVNKQSDLTDMEKLTLIENSGYEIPFVDSHYTSDADYRLLSSKVNTEQILNPKLSTINLVEIGVLIIVFTILLFKRVTKHKNDKEIKQ